MTKTIEAEFYVTGSRCDFGSSANPLGGEIFTAEASRPYGLIYDLPRVSGTLYIEGIGVDHNKPVKVTVMVEELE